MTFFASSVEFSSKKNAVFCICCCFASFFLGKNRLFSYAWMSSLFAPYKNAVLFAYCDPPSHPFSSKNLFSAHVPRGSQKAPRNFAEGTRKASRKHSEKFPEGSQKASRTLPEGSQKAPRRSNEAPRRFPEGSQTLPQGSQKGSQKAPRSSQRLQDAPRRLLARGIASRQSGKPFKSGKEKLNCWPRSREMVQTFFCRKVPG